MKGKKNRKDIQSSNLGHNSYQIQSSELFKIKFDLLKNDISCFIGKNRSSKNAYGKTSKILKKVSGSASVKNRSVSKTKQSKIICKQNTDRTQAPDLIKESSSKILSKIEQKGIRFNWKQEEQAIENKNQLFQDIQTESLLSAFDSSFQKSFASTNDHFNYQSITICWPQSKQIIPQISSKTTTSISNLQSSIISIQQSQLISQSISTRNLFTIQPNYICLDWKTTLMIRNIPNKYTVSQLAQEIDSEHSNTYDFLYLPCDLKNLCNVGYGFINFISTKDLHSFYCKFQQYIWKRYRSQKICSLTYARLQGLGQLIQHFENSKVLNQKQKKYRPIIKYQQIQKMALEQQKR